MYLSILLYRTKELKIPLCSFLYGFAFLYVMAMALDLFSWSIEDLENLIMKVPSSWSSSHRRHWPSLQNPTN